MDTLNLNQNTILKAKENVSQDGKTLKSCKILDVYFTGYDGPRKMDVTIYNCEYTFGDGSVNKTKIASYDISDYFEL